MATRALASVLAATTLAGCAGPPSSPRLITTEVSDGYPAALLEGTLHLTQSEDHACWTVVPEGGAERYLLLLPEGSQLSDDEASLRIRDANADEWLRDGDTVKVGGGESHVAEWGGALGQCDATDLWLVSPGSGRQ